MRPSACSGGMYAGVPMIVPSTVDSGLSASRFSSTRSVWMRVRSGVAGVGRSPTTLARPQSIT